MKHALSFAALVILTTSIFLTGCSSATKEARPPELPNLTRESNDRDDSPPLQIPEAELPENIDYVALGRSLGLQRAAGVLGYLEKSFATCQAGYGYSSSRNCRRDFFTVIHFQLLCRDSEGTISTVLNRDDMKPLSGRSANWTLHGRRGEMQLDSEGQGQIQMTFATSPRSQRLKLTVDNDFLYLRAGEINRVVVPANWCN